MNLAAILTEIEHLAVDELPVVFEFVSSLRDALRAGQTREMAIAAARAAAHKAVDVLEDIQLPKA